LEALGPDQPTLCAGWRTRDLLAHLILRERRPLAALGIALPGRAGYTARAQRDIAPRPYAGLLATLRGPPAWWPLRLPWPDRAGARGEHRGDVHPPRGRPPGPARLAAPVAAAGSGEDALDPGTHAGDAAPAPLPRRPHGGGARVRPVQHRPGRRAGTPVGRT